MEELKSTLQTRCRVKGLWIFDTPEVVIPLLAGMTFIRMLFYGHVACFTCSVPWIPSDRRVRFRKARLPLTPALEHGCYYSNVPTGEAVLRTVLARDRGDGGVSLSLQELTFSRGRWVSV